MQRTNTSNKALSTTTSSTTTRTGWCTPTSSTNKKKLQQCAPAGGMAHDFNKKNVVLGDAVIFPRHVLEEFDETKGTDDVSSPPRSPSSGTSCLPNKTKQVSPRHPSSSQSTTPPQEEGDTTLPPLEPIFTLRFASKVRCRFIEGREELRSKSTLPNGTSSIWYNLDEIGAMHDDVVDSIDRMNAKESLVHTTLNKDRQLDEQSPYHQDDGDLDYCVRGLERHRLRDATAQYAIQARKDSIHAVLWEQMQQRCIDEEYNDEMLAFAYGLYSMRCQYAAYTLAKNDEAYVNQHVR